MVITVILLTLSVMKALFVDDISDPSVCALAFGSSGARFTEIWCIICYRLLMLTYCYMTMASVHRQILSMILPQMIIHSEDVAVRFKRLDISVRADRRFQPRVFHLRIKPGREILLPMLWKDFCLSRRCEATYLERQELWLLQSRTDEKQRKIRICQSQCLGKGQPYELF
jgi:hypothetical protein